MERTVHTSVHVLKAWPPEVIQQNAGAIKTICNKYKCHISYNSQNASFEISSFSRDELRGAKEDMVRQIRKMESIQGLVPIPFPDDSRSMAIKLGSSSQESLPIYEMAHTDDDDTHSIVSEGSGPTIDAHHTSLSSSASSSSSIEGIPFEVDHRIRKPFEFFFVDRSRKDDLREVIAEKHGCRVDRGPTGRTMTFFGLDMENVKACIQDMTKVQAHYLRPRFRAKEICLVQNSDSEPFRVVLVPLSSHDHYSKVITFVPSRYPQPMSRHQLQTLFKAVRARKSLMTQKWTVTPVAHPLPGIQDLMYPDQLLQRKQPATEAALNSWTTVASSASDSALAPPTDTFGCIDEGKWPPLSDSGKTKLPADVSDARITSVALDMQQQKSRPMSLVVQPFGGGGEFRRLPEKAWPASERGLFQGTEFPVIGTHSVKEAGIEISKASTTLTASATSTVPASLMSTTKQDEVMDLEEPLLISFDDDALEFLANKASSCNGDSKAYVKQASLLDDDLLVKPSLMDSNIEAQGLQRSFRELLLQRGPASPPSSSPLLSGNPAENLYNYNLWKMTKVLKHALEELQGRRKEIRLVGRLGHIVYDKVPASGSNKLWEYTHMELLFDTLGVRPVFSPAAFTTQEQFERFHESMDDKPIVSSFFEFQCRSRTNPSSQFMPTIIKVPSDKAVLELVVTPWECFASVKLDSLDTEHGMELRIEAREGLSKCKKSALGRRDVKPFNQFRKKISIGPECRSISCSSIEQYLEVDCIQFKVEYLYMLPSTNGTQFMLKVTRIEDIVLERPSPERCTGPTRGHGRTWYELEIEHQGVAKILEENLTLTPRIVADWTVEDILGSERSETANVTRNFLQQLREVAERCQPV